MKHSLVVSLLLLSLLLSQAQGIRLDKWFKSVMHTGMIHEEENSLVKASNGVVGLVVLCKKGQCTGKNRKLASVTISATSTTIATTPKNSNNGDKKPEPVSKEKSGMQEKPTANPVPTYGRQEISHENYADLMNITEMDYSPARRKPPIHN
ncbi:hypothetical protein CFOL_v3_17388 [Cephalotus follicularis]|uniref:Uncharacterized protein n=1 Tax=Cephalotus follicularis TaxID=3775 RepID=A0A1Q3C0W0_CEPFO|nr:hypothetical protein CFOL_v3_17388 [Cephalotus follicularis]